MRNTRKAQCVSREIREQKDCEAALEENCPSMAGQQCTVFLVGQMESDGRDSILRLG